MSSGLVEEWFGQKELRALFARLDTDKDGLVDGSDILSAQGTCEVERTVIEELRKVASGNKCGGSTFSYKDFFWRVLL